MASGKTLNLGKTALILIIIIIGVLLIAYIKMKSCKYIDCISFDGSKGYKILDVYENQKSSYRALYANDSSKLRVEIRSNIAKDQANIQSNIQITNMKKIFEKERAPYPGEISDTIECDEQFIPKWEQKNVKGVPVDYTSAYLNERYVYGACSQEQIKYRSLMFLFYCPDIQKLYQLELIQPLDTNINNNYYNILIDSLSCIK